VALLPRCTLSAWPEILQSQSPLILWLGGGGEEGEGKEKLQ
jgi:hypothetical protein